MVVATFDGFVDLPSPIAKVRLIRGNPGEEMRDKGCQASWISGPQPCGRRIVPHPRPIANPSAATATPASHS